MMKKILFSEKFQKGLMNVCMYGTIISVILFFKLKHYGDEVGATPSYWLLWITIPFIVYCILYFGSKLPVNKMYVIGEIRDLNESGFTIGSIMEDSSRRIEWDKVEQVKYAMFNTTIDIRFKLGHEISVFNAVDNWYQLALQIPGRFTDFDRDHIRNIGRKSSTCPCCGYIAFYQNDCFNCLFTIWDKEVHDEFNTKKEYLRQMQLERFSISEEGDPVEFRPKEKHEFFKFDRSWRPIVTEEEVREYSRQNK